MTIYFYLKRKDPKVKQPLYCRIQCGMIGGKPDRAVIATKVVCKLKEWDKVNQRVKGSFLEAKKKNQNLLEIEEKLRKIREDAIEEVLAKEIKEEYVNG